MKRNHSSSPLKRALALIGRATASQHRRAIKSDIQRLDDRGVRSLRDLRNVLQTANADPQTRTASCWVIGRLRPSGWIRLLGAIVKTDPHPGVVHAATQQLLQRDTNTVHRVFRDALIDGKEPVNRASAAWALGYLHAESATDLLMDVASQLSEAIEVRAEAVEALGYMSKSSPVDALILLLTDKHGLIRCEAAFSLGNLADPRALPFLKSLAKDDTPCANLGRVSEVAAQASQRIRMMQRFDSTTSRPRRAQRITKRSATSSGHNKHRT